MVTISKIDNISWEPSHGVPIDEARKQKWIEEAIEYLKKNPDEVWSTISGGDTFIMVYRDGNYYEVNEYQPRRWAMIQRDPDDKDPCKCDITTIQANGCQCGGI